VIYYADWIASAISLVGTYFIGRKKWWGWIIQIFNIGIFTYINTVLKLWGFFPLNVMLLIGRISRTGERKVSRTQESK